MSADWTTYERADGEMIADYSWVDGLEWFERDNEPTELIRSRWTLIDAGPFTYHPPACYCDDCGGTAG